MKKKLARFRRIDLLCAIRVFPFLNKSTCTTFIISFPSLNLTPSKKILIRQGETQKTQQNNLPFEPCNTMRNRKIANM